jgi:hypothetical protein
MHYDVFNGDADGICSLVQLRLSNPKNSKFITGVESVIHSDGWRGYNGLVDFGYKKHFRVHHGKNEFVRGNSHINGIESFWGYAKTRLVKFKGMDKKMFNLHLKECEFRFNNRKQNIYKVLLGIFRKEPLKLS